MVLVYRFCGHLTTKFMAVYGEHPLLIAVNRVDPEPYRAVSPFRDIKLNRAMRGVELAHG